MQELGDRISEAAESLFATVGPLLTTPEDATTLTALAAAADAFARVMSDAASEIDELRPPADIAEAHSEFRAGFSETRDRFAELAVTADEAKCADEPLSFS